MDAKTESAIAETYVKRLHDSARTGKPVELSLETDDRVLARVTDGIYRQPASAIRELIANAYDADATEVAVLTDAPRYSQILVRDNGNGMSASVLINLVQHIGGSAKRTPVGQKLGVTDPDDPRLSRGKRRLIGKIGIGMFSVSQLTRQFTIITKPKDEDYRYTAVVTLHRYTDENLGSVTPETMFKSGETVITSERVGPDEAHGTTILLGDIIDGAKDMLQNREVWSALTSPDPGVQLSRVVHAIHSGVLRHGSDDYEVLPKVPWKPDTPPDVRMKLLSDELFKSAQSNELYASLSNAFDYYFRMVWGLGLSLPLPYIEHHPFELPDGLSVKCFRLSNKTRASSSGPNQATELKTGPRTNVGSASGMEPSREGQDFRVEIDGIQLFRPIRFDTIPGTARALQTPLLFVGSYKPNLSKFDKTQRGGENLAFVGYFFWSPRVIPKEHNGLLIRINGASGTLFDPTFMNYQVAEQTRLKQLVAEVLVSDGLEEALNIDRETFNTAHPHYQILLNWVHNALRQVFNKQKDLESAIRTERRTQQAATNRSAVQQARSDELRKILGDDEDTVREVLFTDDKRDQEKAEQDGKRVFPRNDIVVAPVLGQGKRESAASRPKVSLYEERAGAVAQLLDAYGLLEHLGPNEQRKLLAAIIRIFNTGE